MKKLMKTVGELLSPSDPLLVEKTLARLDEQDRWNDVFSTKLIQLLDNIDDLKAEVRQRLREVDAIRRAESVLAEEAARFTELQNKCEIASLALESARFETKSAKSALESARSETETATQNQLRAAQELGLASSQHTAAKSAYSDACQLTNEAAANMEVAKRHCKIASQVALVASSVGLQIIVWTCWYLVRSHLSLPLPVTLTLGISMGTAYGITRLR